MHQQRVAARDSSSNSDRGTVAFSARALKHTGHLGAKHTSHGAAVASAALTSQRGTTPHKYTGETLTHARVTRQRQRRLTRPYWRPTTPRNGVFDGVWLSENYISTMNVINYILSPQFIMSTPVIASVPLCIFGGFFLAQYRGDKKVWRVCSVCMQRVTASTGFAVTPLRPCAL
jgi:hypothetical protein